MAYKPQVLAVADGGSGQETLTNHGVLIGAGTSAITQLAAGTSGQVLQSGGASSDPAYSTSTYPSTNAINTLLYASAANVMSALATANNGVLITSASGVPSILAAGLTGQTLTATTSSPATWQYTQPNQILSVTDDFVSKDFLSTGIIGSSQVWYVATNGNWTDVAQTTTTNPGNIQVKSLTSGDIPLFLNTTSLQAFQLGGGAIYLNWVIKLNTLSTGTNTYTLYIGMSATQGAEPVDGVYFLYTNGVNSGNWVCKTSKASTRTAINTSTAATTSYVNLGIQINAAGTSAQYFINGVSAGTNVTNLPTAAISAGMDFVWSAGTTVAGSLEVDLFYMTQVLTTAR
jgi:hypothetical protein